MNVSWTEGEWKGLLVEIKGCPLSGQLKLQPGYREEFILGKSFSYFM
jgi:hypothetical protein